MFSRRRFLQALAGLTASMMVGSRGGAGEPPGNGQAKSLPMRELGRTGVAVSSLTLGGSHLVRLSRVADVQRVIEASIEEGVTFFDTAASYGRGRSERYFGEFLVPRHRERSFIMTKSNRKDRAGVEAELDESRRRMGVDVIDLWQIHEIADARDVDARVSAGVLDAFFEAKEAGRVRYIGFTGHRSPAAHERMFEHLALRGMEMDTVQIPINIVDANYASFIERVLPTAVERGYGVLAMKTLAYGQLMGKATAWGNRGGEADIVPNRVTLAEALGFVWSLPVASLVSGVDNVEQLRENCGIARDFPRLDEDARRAIVDRAIDGVDTRWLEFYKA
jgi:aryl-alcohol dehydrogenase-like predicted oxidoreductase